MSPPPLLGFQCIGEYNTDDSLAITGNIPDLINKGKNNFQFKQIHKALETNVKVSPVHPPHSLAPPTPTFLKSMLWLSSEF